MRIVVQKKKENKYTEFPKCDFIFIIIICSSEVNNVIERRCECDYQQCP